MKRRNSAQKQMILDALKKLKHPTVQEVLDEVIKQYPHMSRATVYRNLHLLAEYGVIKSLTFPDSPERFDLQMSMHYHMTCTRCGEIFNIEQEYFKDIDEKIAEDTGFSIESHTIYFKGVCHLCKMNGP